MKYVSIPYRLNEITQTEQHHCQIQTFQFLIGSMKLKSPFKELASLPGFNSL